MDMTEGIITHFRTMAIARSSVLIGHVLGSVIQTMLATALVVVVGGGHRFPPDNWPGRLARGGGAPGADGVRRHLALGRARTGSQ